MSLRDPVEIQTRRLAAALAGSGLRIATAESCTGGQLAALFARDVELGPSLERGFIVYSIDAKCEMLGVSRDDAERCEAVNPDVARAMAQGALDRARADVAAAITGFCGPQEKDEEVGLVYVATADRDALRIEEHHFGDVGRETVLGLAAGVAVAMLADAAERLGQTRGA
ncbi:CinA family protein [Sphingopyxis chilensis]|uniref:CinA family protein n=1 Tax=Sphingopyxis chilensis TaxID=180400 RepID=UPI002DDCC9BD|nr:nicotinamide-nucleotide amidohydrolase family protein [Sphingopyxis chilensis]